MVSPEHSEIANWVKVLRYSLDHIGLPIICLLGLIGNTLSVIVFTRRSMKSPFSTLLLGLSFFDSLYLIRHFFYGIKEMWSAFKFLEQMIGREITHAIYDFTIRFGEIGSIYFTIAISVERFIAVYYPLKVQQISTIRRYKRIIILIVLLDAILNIPFPLQALRPNDNNLKIFKEQYDVWFCSLYAFVLPFLSLAILNIMIYFKIRRATQQRASMSESAQASSDSSTTKTLLWIVIVFGICYSPFVLTRILTGWFETTVAQKNVKYFVMSFNEFGPVVNSSVNFIIYFATAERFRETFKKLVNSTLAHFGSPEETPENANL